MKSKGAMMGLFEPMFEVFDVFEIFDVFERFEVFRMSTLPVLFANCKFDELG